MAEYDLHNNNQLLSMMYDCEITLMTTQYMALDYMTYYMTFFIMDQIAVFNRKLSWKPKPLGKIIHEMCIIDLFYKQHLISKLFDMSKTNYVLSWYWALIQFW